MAWSPMSRNQNKTGSLMANLRSLSKLVPGTSRAQIVGYVLALVALAGLSACAGAEPPRWTFAPLGPTPPSVPGSPAASPPAASPGAPATPGASPGGDGVTFDTVTPADDPLTFVPNSFSAAPAIPITVNYLNDSQLPHNIRFFAGPDANAPSIAATEIVTGADNLQSITFTSPDNPGEYFFHCDVHPQQMQGTLTVEP